MRIATNAAGVVSAAVNEQDSIADVMSCVQMIASCPQGAWVDRPGYGVPSIPFSQTPIDATSYAAAVMRSEPRAIATAESFRDLLDPSAAWLQVNVSTQQADQ